MTYHKTIRFYKTFFIFVLVVVALHVFLFISPLPITGNAIDTSTQWSSVEGMFPFAAIGLLVLLVIFLHWMKPQPFRGSRIPLRI